MNTLYQSGQKSQWQGRLDFNVPKGLLHKIVSPVDLEKDAIVKKAYYLLGFCSDEGVFRNQGRVGAENGPASIRNALANVCVHPGKKDSIPEICDAGNVTCKAADLENAQKELGEKVALIVAGGGTPIVLGGGHETSWGHFQGLTKQKKLSIVNFDAHFDLRPVNNENPGSSGTPFSQISNYCAQNKMEFDYSVLGIQKMSNNRNIYKRASELNVDYVTAEEFFNQSNAAFKQVKKVIERAKKIYLSICLDVFNVAFAPGVSAISAQGLCPWQVNPLVEEIRNSGKLFALDVVELNPKYDRDMQTAKLAASYISQIILGY